MQTEAGLNERVTVTITYADGTSDRVVMTRRQAIQLQDEVAAGKRSGIFLSELVKPMNQEQDEFCTLELKGVIDPEALFLNVESGHFDLKTDGAVKLTLTLDDGSTLMEVRLTGVALAGSIVKDR